MGVAADALGNIYISDGTNVLIRKVITGLQSPPTATGTTTTLPVEIHFAAGDSPAASNALAYTSTEWSLGTPTCATNADTTDDCLLNSGFTPAVPGARSTPLTVNSALGNTANLGLTGIGLGAGSTLDPATKLLFGANLLVAGLATDTAGNVYVSDAASKKLFRFAPSALTQGASAPSTTLATLTAPGPVAVDQRGFVYVGDTSTGLITQISPSGAISTLALKLTTPAGLTTDAVNNLYVSDSSAKAVYQIDPITGAMNLLATGTLVAPAGLAIDAAGNLLIADTADILAVPTSNNSASFTVASVVPSALAIDSAGNLYTGSGSSILKLTRTQGYVQFAAASASPTTVDLLDSGNQALQLSSIGQTDTADYSVAGTASIDCSLTGTLPSALAVGGVCALTASYTPTTFVTTTDTATFNGNYANAALSLPSSVQLTLTGPAAPPASSIALTFLPASPAYGQTVIATATVTGLSLTPAGTVQFTVDRSNTNVTLSGGVATLSLPSLSAGAHTVSAVYTSSNGYLPATASSVILTVGKTTPAVILTSNLNPTLAQSAITFTAKVTSAAGTPTQTVTFLDGTTTIGTGTLSGGVATLTISTLAAGTHSITAAYGGDANFATASSSTLAELVEDFGFTISTPSVTVLPGGTAVFTFTVAPVDASTFLAAINLTVGGLPPGATYTITPATLAAGAASTTVTLTINIPKTQAGATPYTMHPGQQLAASKRGSGAGYLARRLTPFALALLLLPFAGRLRRTGKKLGRVMLVLLLLTSGAAIMTWMGGCGATSGYFTQQQQTYTVTVTGTSGALSHSATVTLTVE